MPYNLSSKNVQVCVNKKNFKFSHRIYSTDVHGGAIHVCGGGAVHVCGACVGIHKNFTVTDILVFGRETGFPTQTLQRWYLYKSLQEMETNLINVCQSWYWVLILDGHSKDFYKAYWATEMLTQEESSQLYNVIRN